MDPSQTASAFDLNSLPAQRLKRRILSRYNLRSDELPFSRSNSGLIPTHHISFSSYDYLDLRRDPRLLASAGHALSTYGLTTSSSRLLGGELPCHQSLENKLAQLYEQQSSLLFVSGHSVNVYAVSALLDSGDLIIADQYCHSSILSGCQLSKAKLMVHRHLDLAHLEDLLSCHRHLYGRCLLITESLFSMHGDIPDLTRLLDIRDRYNCYVMVDEAHALGVMGSQGMGLANYFNISPRSVDIWCGSLSKALASTGGYVASSAAIIDHLRYFASGFAYSVGLNAPCCAAAESALDILSLEPERCSRLLFNAHYLHNALTSAGLCSHSHFDSPVISIRFPPKDAILVSQRMRNQGILVFPILPPAVPDSDSGIRLFVTLEHAPHQLDAFVKALVLAAQS